MDCEDCAELSDVSVACTPEEVLVEGEGDGDGSGSDETFTIPVIAGIAVAAAVLLLCLGFCAVRWKKKRDPLGNHTFADDSEHGSSLARKATPGAGVVVGGEGGSGSGGSGAGTVGTVGTAPGAADSGVSSAPFADVVVVASSPVHVLAKDPAKKMAKSFKAGHEAAAGRAVYDGLFSSQGGGSATTNSRQGSRSGSVEISERRFTSDFRKDSMAAAAAAAAAASVGSRSSLAAQQQQQQVAYPAARAPAAGGGGARGEVGGAITWSAGQVIHNRRRGNGPAALDLEDSAAGSVYSTPAPEEEEEEEEEVVEQHEYYDYDDSVAASSPGAYSLYSHYTVGGGAYPAGRQWSEAGSSDGEGEGDGRAAAGAAAAAAGRRHYYPQHSREMQIPPPSMPPSADQRQQVGGVATGGRANKKKPLSPAGMVARASLKGENVFNARNGRPGETDEGTAPASSSRR